MTTDYVSFFLSFPQIPPQSLLMLFFLGLMRIAPIVAYAPFLGAKLPGGVKMGLAISLTVIMLPYLMGKTHQTMEFNSLYIGYMLKEFFMGAILALFITIPFYIAESAGVLIDFLRGSTALQVDPLMQHQVSSIGQLYNYVLVVLFFQINGPFIVFDALLSSYDVIPVDALLDTRFFTLSLPFWQAALHTITRVTAISIQLAAPSLVAILMAEMFLGIANRLAPQVQIAFLGMSIKSLLGIALLFAAWFFILQQMGKQTLMWINDLDKIMHTFSF